MNQRVYRRIAAGVLMLAMVLAGTTIRIPFAAGALDNMTLGLSLGSSNVPPPPGEDKELDDASNIGLEENQNEGFALGFSSDDVITSEPVMDFSTLQSILQTGTDDVYIELGADITMTAHITVKGTNRVIMIDGLGQYGIDQGGNYSIICPAGADITLKDMTVTGRYYHGIVESRGANGKTTFDNITYTGPQPYYSSGLNGTLTIKNGGTFYIQKQTDSKGSTSPQEFTEAAFLVFDGGNTSIYHAINDGNTTSVFFLVNGNNGTHIKLVNEAAVNVQTGNYVFYTGLGDVPIILEDGCSLEITAAAFNLSLSHRIKLLEIGENATFSYTQKGTPNATGALREMYITGSLVVQKGATFQYESSKGLRSIGTNHFYSPKLVSIYGAESAFYNASGTWNIDSINAVNYWEKGVGQPSPVDDAALNWPQYIWNTWVKTDLDTYEIGPRFSITGSSGNVTSGGDLTDVMLRSSASLGDTLRFNTTAQRLVFGNITPFEVQRISSMQGIYGNIGSGDIMAQFETVNGETKWITGTSLPLEFMAGEYPKSGSTVDVIANNGGLRAGVKTETFGTLELVTIPETIYYGEHEVPVQKTVYQRERSVLSEENGAMAVNVVDSRGDLSSSWELTLRIGEEALPGKQLLPPSTLFFVTHEDEQLLLENGAVAIYRHGKAESEYANYKIIWPETQGLLAQVYPGQVQQGSYGAVLHWAVQVVPEV